MDDKEKIKIPITMEQHFGPFILESKCPQNIVDSLNKFTEDACSNEEMQKKFCSSSGNTPNLLLRDFEVVFLTENFCEDIGLKEFVEKLGNYYLESSTCHYHNVKLSIVNKNSDQKTKQFEYADKITYADAWVNRYYSGDYTPLHAHAPSLAGIIILKYPKKELEKENSKNSESDTVKRSGGKLTFVYGANNLFCGAEYSPDQFECQTLIFPSWLSHLVYPMKTNSERRTLSFNLISEREYYERKQEFNHGLFKRYC